MKQLAVRKYHRYLHYRQIVFRENPKGLPKACRVDKWVIVVPYEDRFFAGCFDAQISSLWDVVLFVKEKCEHASETLSDSPDLNPSLVIILVDHENYFAEDLGLQRFRQ